MDVKKENEIQTGLIRLVNPWRGRIWCCNLKLKEGVLSARTGGKDTKAFQDWEIYFIHRGLEYYCGRSFPRQELMRWFGSEMLPKDDLPQEDFWGSIPANTSAPQEWNWYAFSQGELVLEQYLKPTAADFQKVCGYALLIARDKFYPFLDCFEIWVGDKETLEPLALVATGNSLAEIDYQFFSPRVRFDWDLKDDHPALRTLEREINRSINASSTPGKFSYCSRIFERKLDNTVVEYRRKDPSDLENLPQKIDSDISVLPSNWLGDRYWPRYQQIISEN